MNKKKLREIASKYGLFVTFMNKMSTQVNAMAGININESQLKRIYTTKEHDRDMSHLPKFKSFAEFVLFVLFHEIGHWELNHVSNVNYFIKNKDKCQKEADKWAARELEKGGY